VKRPTMLVEALLRQAALDLDLSVERDVCTIRRRCKHEGLSFLTLTLPELSDALEQGLESGHFSCPSAFARHGRLPRLLGGFFKCVFTMDGTLIDDAPGDVIYYIRQICRFFKKPKMSCSPEKNLEAIQRFVDIEGELRSATLSVEREDYVLDSISQTLWSQVFPEIDYSELICHHGPGVTSERLLSNERRRIRFWNTRSELTFPSDLHAFPNYGLAFEASGIRKDASESELTFLNLKQEKPVRVVFVPKTMKAPRVIAIEPSHVQYIQQSVKDYVYERLESHRLTKRSIRFERQDVNQRLAYQGSIDRRTATLDLSDASDRVHFSLVQRIFKSSGLLPFLEDARSLHADLPDGRNVILTKYASMGSALCFPVEAMVFFTLVLTAIHRQLGRRPTSSSIYHYSGMIDIYGDDIIVPVEFADAVVSTLESYALKVNVSKSFSKGFFRESCGADFYRGEWVTPIYARQIPPDNSRGWNPEIVMSWVATADLFYMRGQWIVAQTIRDLITSEVDRSIPRSKTHGPGLYFYSYIFSTRCFYSKQLHGFMQYRREYRPSKQKDSIDGDEIACLNHWGQYVAKRRVSHDFDNSSCRDTTGGGKTRRGASSESLCGLSADSDVSLLHTDWFLSQKFTSSEFQDFSASSSCTMEFFPSGSRTAKESSERGSDAERPWENRDYILALLRSKIDIDLLTGKSVGLCFQTSVKRGRFKSKGRWVSLAG